MCLLFEAFDYNSLRMTGFGDNELYGFFCVAGQLAVQPEEL